MPVYQPLMRRSMLCRDLVDAAKKYHLRPDLRPLMQSDSTRVRTGKQHLAIFGSRDVNSFEIAFPPGWELQFPGLDRVWISPKCVPFANVIGVGSPAWSRRWKTIADWYPALFPADARTPSIDRHSRRWCAQNGTKQLGVMLKDANSSH